MRRILTALALAGALAIAACASQSVPTGDTAKQVLYTAELSFKGGLLTFNALKGACERKTLPEVCVQYVVQGQDYIRRVHAVDLEARKWVKANPTATTYADVLQLFISAVGGFTGAVADLKRLR